MSGSAGDLGKPTVTKALVRGAHELFSVGRPYQIHCRLFGLFDVSLKTDTLHYHSAASNESRSA